MIVVCWYKRLSALLLSWRTAVDLSLVVETVSVFGVRSRLLGFFLLGVRKAFSTVRKFSKFLSKIKQIDALIIAKAPLVAIHLLRT